MTAIDTSLPRSVLSPLYRANFALLAFISALFVWATFAPLATTLKLSGQIISSLPSFEIQHPYGGLVQDVLVDRHDAVVRGQVLLRLDTALDQQNLTHLQQEKKRLLQQNSTIQALLVDPPSVLGSPDLPSSPLALKYLQAQEQKSLKQDSQNSLMKQVSALREKIGFMQSQLELAQDRVARQRVLVGQGLVSQNSIEALEEQVLLIQGEIKSDQASLISLNSQASQAQKQAALIELNSVTELAAQKEINGIRLDEIEKAEFEIKERLKHSEVRAPVDGTVTNMFFQSSGMYVSHGATVASLAQPLVRPHVSFVVPTSHIDQIRSGMSGTLLIASLPQRSTPKVRITIRAVALRANKDEGGNPSTYSGVADINPEDWETLKEALDQAELSEDMPASLVIEVRETTFANFLITPFFAAFSNALQD